MGKTTAEICLYGAQHCGYGWLAAGPATLEGGKLAAGMKLYGKGGEGLEHVTASGALWEGLWALREAGLRVGTLVTVHAPGGEKAARYFLGEYTKCFGQLAWCPTEEYLKAIEGPYGKEA